MRGVARLLIACALLVGLSACSSGGADEPAPPPNPVTGNIVSIEGKTLTLEARSGETYGFTIADPTVPVDHLKEHEDDRLPVRITWRRQGEKLLATTIADA